MPSFTLLSNLRNSLANSPDYKTGNPLLDAKEIPSSQEETPDFNALINNSLFRREFKIQGQIGEASQNDKISFISLMRQIREAKPKAIMRKTLRVL